MSRTPEQEQATFDRVCHYVRVTRGLSFKVRSKSESWLMKLIGTLLFFNPAFMTRYTTTIGSTIYFPDGYVAEHPGPAWRTVAHEGVHLQQDRRSWLYPVAYLFPLPLALLALGAFWALWFLLALVFLAPLPAYWRVKYEREAYLVSAACDATLGTDVLADWYLDYMVEHHCGWAYYKPAWRRGRMRELIRQDMVIAKKLAAGELTDPYITGLLAIVRPA